MSQRSLVANYLWGRVLAFWEDGDDARARHTETYYGHVEKMSDKEFECIESKPEVQKEEAPV